MSCLKYTSAWSRPLKPAPPEGVAARACLLVGVRRRCLIACCVAV